MLKLMSEENNSNIGQNPENQSAGDSTGGLANPAQANLAIDKKNKSGLKFTKIFAIVITLIVLIAVSAAAGYSYGKSKNKPVATPAATPKPIDLPPEAIVTSECTPGRGKQYIIPKDIPGGPIYDVKSSKVIAIEYNIGVKTLLTKSDNFSDTILLLTKNYPVDHFSIVPVQPKAGDTDQYIHLIMFVVSKDEANSITCKDSSTSTSTSASQTDTTSDKQTSTN